MREDEVFLLTKDWVIAQGFKILGGQPPNGTERFPVIEIKSEENAAKGSQSSFKPDLVVATSSALVVIECKPEFASSDAHKLTEIAQSHQRLDALIRDLRQRRSLERHQPSLAKVGDAKLAHSTQFCLAYSGEHRSVSGMYSLVFNRDGSAVALYFGELPIETFSS